MSASHLARALFASKTQFKLNQLTILDCDTKFSVYCSQLGEPLGHNNYVMLYQEDDCGIEGQFNLLREHAHKIYSLKDDIYVKLTEPQDFDILIAPTKLMSFRRRTTQLSRDPTMHEIHDRTTPGIYYVGRTKYWFNVRFSDAYQPIDLKEPEEQLLLCDQVHLCPEGFYEFMDALSTALVHMGTFKDFPFIQCYEWAYQYRAISCEHFYLTPEDGELAAVAYMEDMQLSEPELWGPQAINDLEIWSFKVDRPNKHTAVKQLMILACSEMFSATHKLDAPYPPLQVTYEMYRLYNADFVAAATEALKDVGYSDHHIDLEIVENLIIEQCEDSVFAVLTNMGVVHTCPDNPTNNFYGLMRAIFDKYVAPKFK